MSIRIKTFISKLAYFRPGILSLKGQGRFHFAKGTSILKLFKSMGNFWMGTKAKIGGNGGPCVLFQTLNFLIVNSVCMYVRELHHQPDRISWGLSVGLDSSEWTPVETWSSASSVLAHSGQLDPNHPTMDIRQRRSLTWALLTVSKESALTEVGDSIFNYLTQCCMTRVQDSDSRLGLDHHDSDLSLRTSDLRVTYFSKIIPQVLNIKLKQFWWSNRLVRNAHGGK